MKSMHLWGIPQLGCLTAMEMNWVHVIISKTNGRTGTGSKFRRRSASTVKIILKLGLRKGGERRTCVLLLLF